MYTPGLSERRGTTSKFYHGDALGSTRGITSSSQSVTDTVLYDGFGMTVSRTGTTPTPFGFVAKTNIRPIATAASCFLANATTMPVSDDSSHQIQSKTEITGMLTVKIIHSPQLIQRGFKTKSRG